MISLKKALTGAAAASLFAATSAIADESAAAQLTKGQILSADETVTIIVHPDLSLPVANEYWVLCPGYPELEEAFPNTGAVVALLYKATHEELRKGADETLKAAQKNNVDKEKDHFPAGNHGMIRPDGTLQTAYTLGQSIDLFYEFLKYAEPVPGVDATQPELIQRLRSHAESFCFARY